MGKCKLSPQLGLLPKEKEKGTAPIIGPLLFSLSPY